MFLPKKWSLTVENKKDGGVVQMTFSNILWRLCYHALCSETHVDLGNVNEQPSLRYISTRSIRFFMQPAGLCFNTVIERRLPLFP